MGFDERIGQIRRDRIDPELALGAGSLGPLIMAQWREGLPASPESPNYQETTPKPSQVTELDA